MRGFAGTPQNESPQRRRKKRLADIFSRERRIDYTRLPDVAPL